MFGYTNFFLKICKIFVFHILVAPEIEMDVSMKERIIVHVGGVIRIIAYVSGHPTPEITWNRDNGVVPPEAVVETTSISTSLVIKNCIRKQQGVYSLTAKNAGGEVKRTVIVDVLGKQENLDIYV